MSNSKQREWIRMRRDAEMDRRTEIRAAERNADKNAKLEVAKGLKEEGIDAAVIARVTGLSAGEITKL